jgi:hypothetical protein
MSAVGVPIRNLPILNEELSVSDFLPVGAGAGTTNRITVEQLKNLILRFVEAGELNAADIVAALDAYFEGTGWRDGTGVPAPQAVRFRPVIVPGQRIVTFLHTVDVTKPVMVYRNGLLTEITSVDGTDITLSEPNLREGELVVILAFDANA